MSDEDNMVDTKPQGVVITLREIHDTVGRIENALNSEITKLKIRIAAHEVIIGMMTIVIVFLTQKGLTP